MLGWFSGTGAVKPRHLNANETEEALQRGNVFLLDVREPGELKEFGTIQGYVNIPIGQLEKRLHQIPKNKVIVTL